MAVQPQIQPGEERKVPAGGSASGTFGRLPHLSKVISDHSTLGLFASVLFFHGSSIVFAQREPGKKDRTKCRDQAEILIAAAVNTPFN